MYPKSRVDASTKATSQIGFSHEPFPEGSLPIPSEILILQK